MVLFNHSTRELTAKIVYYGPGLCGKTTNLKVLHDRLEKGTAGRLLSLSTAQDRTIYFDLLPVELGNIKGYTVRFQLCTVPGQVFYNETRKLVLRGVDGVVFVVDSQWSMLSHNLESFQNLKENLRDADATLESLPVVVQYNKRDLPGVLSVEALQESLGFQNYAHVEAVANDGRGVVETFKLVSKLTFVDLLRRLQRNSGLESEIATAAAAPDPGEETSVRSTSRPERRSSFVEPARTGSAAVAAPLSPDSPFDASPGWPAPASSDEVFADAVSPPTAPRTETEPFSAEAPAGVAAPQVLQAVPRITPETAPAPAATRGETEALRQELSGLHETVEALKRDLAALAGRAVTAEAVEALKTRVDGLPGPLRHEISQRLDPTVRDVSELRTALATQRDEAGGRLDALGGRYESLLEKHEALAGRHDGLAGRHDALAGQHKALADEQQGAGKVTADLREELKGEVRRLEGAMASAFAQLETVRNDLESTSGALRKELEAARAVTVEEGTRARDGLREEIGRLDAALAEHRNGLDRALASHREALEETQKGVRERLATAEERTRRLTDSLRRALDEPGS